MSAKCVFLLVVVTIFLVDPSNATTSGNQDLQVVLNLLGDVITKVAGNEVKLGAIERKIDALGDKIDALKKDDKPKDDKPNYDTCKKGMIRHPKTPDYPHYVVYNGNDPYLCDTATDSGGWIIIQRRVDGSTDFYRGWDDYRRGFGSQKGNYWIGLDWMHTVTTKHRYEMRVDMRYKGVWYYAYYSSFSVGGPATYYKLSVGGYKGNAGDSLTTVHNGMAFTTKDRDYDKRDYDNCAVQYRGGWWYNSCHHSNLNGIWGDVTFGRGLNWKALTGHEDTVTYSEMKIRRVQY